MRHELRCGRALLARGRRWLGCGPGVQTCGRFGTGRGLGPLPVGCRWRVGAAGRCRRVAAVAVHRGPVPVPAAVHLSTAACLRSWMARTSSRPVKVSRWSARTSRFSPARSRFSAAWSARSASASSTANRCLRLANRACSLPVSWSRTWSRPSAASSRSLAASSRWSAAWSRTWAMSSRAAAIRSRSSAVSSRCVKVMLFPAFRHKGAGADVRFSRTDVWPRPPPSIVEERVGKCGICKRAVAIGTVPVPATYRCQNRANYRSRRWDRRSFSRCWWWVPTGAVGCRRQARPTPGHEGHVAEPAVSVTRHDETLNAARSPRAATRSSTELGASWTRQRPSRTQRGCSSCQPDYRRAGAGRRAECDQTVQFRVDDGAASGSSGRAGSPRS